LRRTSYLPENRNYHEKLIAADNIGLCMAMLATHRDTAAIANEFVGRYEVNKLRANKKKCLATKGIVAYPEILHSKGYSIAFLKKSNHPEITHLAQKIRA